MGLRWIDIKRWLKGKLYPDNLHTRTLTLFPQLRLRNIQDSISIVKAKQKSSDYHLWKKRPPCPDELLLELSRLRLFLSRVWFRSVLLGSLLL